MWEVYISFLRKKTQALKERCQQRNSQPAGVSP